MRAAIAAVVAVGCILPIEGSGVEVTEERDVGVFSAVRASSVVDVVVVEATEGGGVSLTCDDNLVEHVVTEVRDGELVVGTTPGTMILPEGDCFVLAAASDLTAIGVSGSGRVEATGDWRSLRDVHVSGSGDALVKGVDAGAVALSVSGSGRIAVHGRADHLDARVSGSGDVDAADLPVTNAEVHVSGSGSVFLTASGHVDAHVSGSGDVVVGGDPNHVDRHVSGSGSIRVR
jgi:hypothetical protein